MKILVGFIHFSVHAQLQYFYIDNWAVYKFIGGMERWRIKMQNILTTSVAGYNIMMNFVSCNSSGDHIIN
jgi:hypothetical protein